MEKLIEREMARQVLMVGEYFKNNAPGGMAAVLASYDEYFEDMKFLASWKAGGFFTKLWYAIYSYVAFVFLMVFDKKIRIVHIQGAAFASFERNTFFVKVGKLFGKKVIMHMHCADFESYFRPSSHQARIIRTINACDRFLVLSEQWKSYFEGIGVPPNIIVVLNNTITPLVQHTVEAKGKCRRVRLLYLGIIGQRKGIYDLLAVIGNEAEYFRENIELHIGGNCEEEKLKSCISEYGIGDFVSFKGFVKGRMKTEELNWADVFILPSYNEGLPIAILEAMSYGMPVISTNVGGIPEIVRNDVNGKLIEPGDKSQIKDSIVYYAEHREAIATHGKASLEIVKPFLPESVFKSLKELYLRLLDE